MIAGKRTIRRVRKEGAAQRQGERTRMIPIVANCRIEKKYRDRCQGYTQRLASLRGLRSQPCEAEEQSGQIDRELGEQAREMHFERTGLATVDQ